ncbi:enoyl-CoA hydratase-related protein [Chloroflexota bacterium]
MGDYQFVKLEVMDYIATVTLDRPPVNALSMDLYRDIGSVFREISDRTDDVHVAILTGAGRCFCAGRDLKLAENDPWEKRSALARAAYGALYHCAVPVIAAVNGPAMGAGFVSTSFCDLIIASEKAVFALPEIDAGLNMSMAAMTRWLNTGHARKLAFTGERVSGHELYRMGMVEKVVPHDELMPEALKLAKVLASKSPGALRAAKWSANEVEKLTDHEQAYRAIEARVSMALFDTEDRREAGKAFVEKRPPTFKGK